MTINELTHKIIGSAIEVHLAIGNGYQEVVLSAGTGDRI